ncbi:unnamed protein product [Heterobilharzia americana]|nr:unnamed protein product [Heterobilharzia americana]
MISCLLISIFALRFVTATEQPKLDYGHKDLACDALDFVQEEVIYLLKQGQFKRNLIEYISSVICDNLDQQSQRHKCNTHIASQTKLFLKNFIEASTHKRINSMLSWCHPYAANLKDDNSSYLCSGCETVITFVKTLTVSSTAKDLIHEAVTKLCSLAGALQTQCSLFGTFFIDSYLQTLSTMTPEEVCECVNTT